MARWCLLFFDKNLIWTSWAVTCEINKVYGFSFTERQHPESEDCALKETEKGDAEIKSLKLKEIVEKWHNWRQTPVITGGGAEAMGGAGKEKAAAPEKGKWQWNESEMREAVCCCTPRPRADTELQRGASAASGATCALVCFLNEWTLTWNTRIISGFFHGI